MTKTMRAVFLIAIYLFSVSFGAYAMRRDADGCLIWESPGGNPRGGQKLETREQYRAWFLSAHGYNDLVRTGVFQQWIPMLQYPVQNNLWDQTYVFRNNFKVRLSETYITPGTIYAMLTFSRAGQRLEKVKAMFTAKVYRIVLNDPQGGCMVIDTFEICSNQGRPFATITLKPPASPPALNPPNTTPLAPPEMLPCPVYRPQQTVVLTYNQAQSSSYEVKGVLPNIIDALGRIYQAVPKFNQTITGIGGNGYGGTGNGYGGTGNGYGGAGGAGGNAVNGSVNNTNTLQQQQQTLNQNQLINTTGVTVNTGSGNVNSTTTGDGFQGAGQGQGQH